MGASVDHSLLEFHYLVLEAKRPISSTCGHIDTVLFEISLLVVEELVGRVAEDRGILLCLATISLPSHSTGQL